MSIDLEKYKKKPVATSTPSTTQLGSHPAAPILNLNKYKKQPQEFKFNVPETPVDRQNKLNQIQADQVKYDAEAKKANSVGGFLSNFGKALVKNIAPSEVALGKTIAKIIDAPRANEAYTQATKTSADIKTNLLKAIRENKARGIDTSRLELAYNRQVAGDKQIESKLRPTDLPTTGQAVGQIAGTTLDILTAGTYGKSASGANSFKLGLNQAPTNVFAPNSVKFPVKDALPNVAQGVKNLATKPAGLFSKRGALNVAKGAGVGYAYDVSRGLSGERGTEREGEKAFLPGAGTAFGTAVPLVVGLTKTLQNVGTKAGRTEQTVNKRIETLSELEISNKKIEQAISEANKKLNIDLPEGGTPIDVKDFIAKSDVLNTAIDTNGTINTRNALDNFDVMMRPYESKVRESLAKEGTAIPVKDLQKILMERSKDSGIPGGTYRTLENEIKKEISGLAKFADESGNIPLTALQDSKVFRYQHNNYLDKTSDSVSKAIANILKEVVEEKATSIDVKRYNQGLSQLYSIRGVLKALNGKKVEGGRLGRHFSSVIGGAAGSSFGPFGTVIGAEAGAAAKGYQMSQKFGGNVSDQLKIPGSITNQLQQ